MVSRSDAFRYAEQQIVASARVAERVGSGASVTVAPFENFEYKFVGDDVHAVMKLNVSGAKDSRTVSTVIDKLNGNWKVEAEYSNGEKLEF